MNVGGQNYLGVVKGAEQVGVLNNAKIFKISEAKLLPFRINPQQEEVALLDNLKQMLEDGFYFSYGYDITCSR